MSADGMKMFGVMDLNNEFDEGRFSIGLRNSNDKSMRLALTAGYRVASSTAALQTAVPGSASTNYRTASVIAPREFGINVQYSFGSR